MLYSEPDVNQYLYSSIEQQTITPQAVGISYGEDNTAYSQGNTYSELDLNRAVGHEYPIATNYLVEWSREDIN